MASRSLLPLMFTALALFAGCTDDFTVGRQPAADASADGASSADGGADGADGGVDCAALKAQLAMRHDLITACSAIDSFCETILKDECDCDVGVLSGAGAAVENYRLLVIEAKTRGCTDSCKACRTTGPAGFVCDANNRDSGSGFCTDPSAGS